MKIDNLIESKENDCKGLFFESHINLRYLNNILIQEIELKLVKNKSCRGCKHCGMLMDAISNEISENTLDLSYIEEGKVYSPVMEIDSVDRETGNPDDWHIVFNEVELTHSMKKMIDRNKHRINKRK